jgi:hypothetical protein
MVEVVESRDEGRAEVATVKRIKNAYRYDESLGFIVYGPRGYGKTSWCCQVASRCEGTSWEPDYEAIKKWIKFTPKEFCTTVQEMTQHTGHAQIELIWDDAGYWLNRLFWYDPFVKEALRYMTLQRTQFTAIFFSTPSLDLLPNKILQLEDVLRVKIYKRESDTNQKAKLRLAWVKKPWYSDDLSKHGCSTLYMEKFNAFLPDDFYDWYEPLRRSYTVVASQMLAESIAHTKKDTVKAKIEELREELVERDIMVDEAGTKDFKEIVDQQSDPLQLE